MHNTFHRVLHPMACAINTFLSICKSSNRSQSKISIELPFDAKSQLIDDETQMPNRYALFASHFGDVNICLIDIRNFSLIAHSYKPEVSNAILFDFFSITSKFADRFSCKSYRYDVDMVAIVNKNTSENLLLFNELIEGLKEKLSFYIFDSSPYTLNNEKIAISVAFGVSTNQTIRTGIFSAERSLDFDKRNNFIQGTRQSASIPDYKRLSEQAVLFTDSMAKDNAFVLIQPIMDCDTGLIVRYEALIRIKQNDNVLSPAAFIDGVYAFGLSDILFLWVFNEVIEKCDDREISVNILPANIMSHAVRDAIFKTFDQNPSKASHITFELLEVENDGDVSTIADFIDKVRDYGVKIAIDDFGTGYSNFNRVFWEWRVDFIKIDGNFIQRSKYDQRARTMISVIAKMARENGILTIAEFVSDREIFEIVHSCGVDFMQGYYISKGLPLEKKCANDPTFRSTCFLPSEQSNLRQE